MSKHDQHEIKGIIGTCDFFIGSLMHACIAALSHGIPSIGIAYSRKFLGVFESIGLGDIVVDARAMDEAATVEKVIGLCRTRDRVRETLQ